MWKWLKSLFGYVDDYVDRVVITPERVRTLVDDLFAVLHAGVVMSPSPVDNLALAAIEAKIDKDLLAAILVQRLRDLV